MDNSSETDITAEERAQAERGAVLVAAAVSQTQAPQSLREAIERDRSRAVAARTPSAARGLLGRVLTPAGLGGVAALAIVVGGGVALISGGGDSHDNLLGKPTIAQIAAVGGLPSLGPPPRASHGSLAARVENVSFPSWKKLAWRASGERTDTVGGRHVTTVFYRGKGGATIGYSIVAGKAIKGWPGGTDVKGGDEVYRVVHRSGRTTVIWDQEGRTCVVTAPSGLPDAKLMKLVSTESV